MPRVSATTAVPGRVVEAEELWYDPHRWAAWVDGFGKVDSSAGYPEVGGTLTWSSTPAGRGRVNEEVLAHEPRSLHRISFSDPESSGELETKFEIARGDQGVDSGVNCEAMVAIP